MAIANLLSVGTVYQNVAFYSFLILLGCLNFELARHSKELKKFRRIPGNR